MIKLPVAEVASIVVTVPTVAAEDGVDVAVDCDTKVTVVSTGVLAVVCDSVVTVAGGVALSVTPTCHSIAVLHA